MDAVRSTMGTDAPTRGVTGSSPGCRVRVEVHKRLHRSLDRAREEADASREAGVLGVGPRVLSVGAGLDVMVTEYAGRPLSSVRPCTCVGWMDFAFWLLRTARQLLSKLHGAGFLHLDVHADNWVMQPPACARDERPEACAVAWRRALRDTLRLVDYGSAVRTAGGVYRGPTRGGRWDLMAPEQFAPGGRGDVVLGADADEHALAAMLVELTIGASPFAVTARRARQAQYLGHPRRLDPAALREWIHDACWDKLCTPTLVAVLSMLRCAKPKRAPPEEGAGPDAGKKGRPRTRGPVSEAPAR